MNNQEELTHRINEPTLKDLNVHRNRLVGKLKRARRTLADQQLKLKAIETAKGKTEYSVETKKIQILKNVGVELSSYHGGSLNGKDIKKVMNNSAHIFDKLTVIMKEGKRPNSILSNVNVNALRLHFWEVFVLWDGAFLLAQTVGPMEQDTKTYLICIGDGAWQQCTRLHRHPQGSHDAQARRVSNEIYSGGVGR
jgi:hypothetical protein